MNNMGTGNDKIGVTKCLSCEKEIPDGKKFCSLKCKARWKYKNDEEFSKKIKEKNKRYYEQNKEKINKRNAEYLRKRLQDSEYRQKFNNSMLIPNRKSWHKNYKYRKENRLCTSCAKPLIPTEIYKQCLECREKEKLYHRK